MEMTGKLKDVSVDWKTGQYNISFTVNEKPHESINELAACEKLRIDFRKFRKKRSLDANAYYWVLITKIAGKLGTSNTEIHNEMLCKYGQVETIDGSVMTLILDDEILWQKLEALHLKPTSRTRILDNGKLYRVYFVMRGSSTYDSGEMSRLIDGVVSEAKELGIETLPPEELRRMVETWKA